MKLGKILLMNVLRKLSQLCLIVLCLPFVMAGASVAVVALSDLAQGQPGMVSDPIILAVIAVGPWVGSS